MSECGQWLHNVYRIYFSIELKKGKNALIIGVFYLPVRLYIYTIIKSGLYGGINLTAKNLSQLKILTENLYRNSAKLSKQLC